MPSISQRAVENRLASLKKQGQLKRVGSNRYGHWEVHNIIQKGSEDNVVYNSAMISDERAHTILKHMIKTPKITAYELALILDISSRTVEKHLSHLKKQGQLKRVGSNKSGHWQIISPIAKR